MGQKYLPSIKDLKAADRFHAKQNPLPKFKKKTAPKSPKKK